MKPPRPLPTLAAGTTASEALPAILREDLRQIPVTQRGQLEGIISRDHIRSAAATRGELPV